MAPLGGGLATVMEAVPATVMSLAGIWAVTRVLLTNVVPRGDPFHCTTDPGTKPEPSIVSVKAGPPAIAALGESKLIQGGGDEVPPNCTILATDGTPVVLRRKSM